VTARRVSSFDATLSGNSVIVATSGAGIVGPLGGCPRDLWGEMQGDKTINLRASDRFVSTAVLRGAYLRYEGSRNPSGPDHVLLEDGLELGIVASAVPEIARGISSMLSCSLEDAKTDRGGHLPAAVVERVQSEIISPYGVANLWGTTGHRFVLSRRVDAVTSELLATILVGRRKGTIFFLTGRYNNLRHSQIARDVDFEQPAGDDPAQRWFDQFAFPDLIRFKPTAYHQIANFVVAREHRREGLAERLLDAIVAKYAKDDLDRRGAPIEHSQYLLCGRGMWQIGDPPWLARMEKLGFYLRWGAESFFIERDWSPLPPILDAQGRRITNLEYNHSFGLPRRYEAGQTPTESTEHLLDRVPEVIRLAQDPRAKLQYFQTMFDFV
jgi:GNAT superfamily N-acetyltransferase